VYDRRYAAYLERADPARVPFTSSPYLSASRFDSPLIDLLNVKYALSNQREAPPGWELARDGDLRIFRRREPLPRAWVAATAEVVPEDGAILDRLLAPGFDPRRTVLLERAPAEPAGTASEQAAGAVAIERFENGRLVLAAQMERPGWLVLSELYHAGWRVVVDGAPANLYRADYVLRAVPLARGRHTVDMRFLPTSFEVGAGISAGAAAFLVGWVLAARRWDA
jgi:hypothetical protein